MILSSANNLNLLLLPCDNDSCTHVLHFNTSCLDIIFMGRLLVYDTMTFSCLDISVSQTELHAFNWATLC
jgi:hypothetical protein